MYSTPDGSEVKLELAPSRHVTPGGPGPKKKYATPLSPSLTDEVNADDNRALPSTANDELFAWLLQHKVDDEKIANYLCERDIDLTELSELDDEQLKDLLKDIEEESGSKLQMIDKNRFIKGCKKLRPQPAPQQQPQQQPQPQPHHQPPPHHAMLSQQSIPQQAIHRGSHSHSHFQYPAPHPSPSPHHPPYDRNQLINQQYVPRPPYSIGAPQTQVRHMSMGGNQAPPPQPQPQPQPHAQVQYYHHPQSGLPVAHVINPNGNPNRGYYGHPPQPQNPLPQQQQQPQQYMAQNKAQPPPLHPSHYAQQRSQHRQSTTSENKNNSNSNSNNEFNGIKFNAIPLPDEYAAASNGMHGRGGNKMNRTHARHASPPPQQAQSQAQAPAQQGADPDDVTTKGLLDLDELDKEEAASNSKPHHHHLNTNTKSSNIPSGSELGSNLASNVEESQNSYYSAASHDREHDRGNNATMIQHNLQIHHASANSHSASNTNSSGHSPHYSNHSHSGDRDRDRDRGDNNNNNNNNNNGNMVNHSVISAMAPSMMTDNDSRAPRAAAHHNNNNNNGGNAGMAPAAAAGGGAGDLTDRNRAISVMTDIPQIQHETIFLQLNRFNNKDDLKNELYSVITRLKKEIKVHRLRIDSFTKTLEKLKAKHAKQMDQWNKWYIVELKYLGNEYFNALFKFLSTQIQIEYTYIECFSEKLKRLTTAHNSVKANIDQWDMRKLQEFVKDTIVTVTKMKVSSTTISKKKALENVKKNIGSLQKEYEKAKQLLATPRCDHTVRQQTIVYFFNTVTNDYNEKNDNLVLTTTYFCEEHLQEKFNSFILDQRCQIHTMYVKQWLVNVRKNKEKDKITIKSIYQFIETLIVKFSKLYQIDKVTNSYYYYVERFAYICIISIPQIDDIFTHLLDTPKGQKEHNKLANKHQYQLFCKLLDAKYLSSAQ